MRRRPVPALLLLAALLLSLPACTPPAVQPAPSPSPAPSPAPAVRAEPLVLPRTTGSLHPILSDDRVNLSLSGLMWEGLFELDQTFTPRPVLCESHTVSADGLVWTFVLRPDAAFSDGSPLTARDVAASLELARAPQSRFAGRLARVEGVEAGEGSVTVTLSSPNGALPALLDIPIIRDAGGDIPLGTGPYVLGAGAEGAVLTARSGWWRGLELPYDAIPLRSIQAADDLIYAFGTGDISLVCADLTGTGALGFTGDHAVWDYPATSMVYVGYNCSRGPCADPALRRALDRGLDRSTVAVALFSRHARAAALPVSPASPLFDGEMDGQREYSLQVLSDRLEEAGYEKNGEGLWARGEEVLSLSFVVNTDNPFRLSAAEYLAEELNKAGLSVTLEQLSWEDYEKALSRGEFDLYLGETVLSADFDPAPLLVPGGALNFGRYRSEGTEALLLGFQSASAAARPAAARALWTALAREVPFSTLCFKNQSVLTQWGTAGNLTPTQQNPFYGLEHWTVAG